MGSFSRVELAKMQKNVRMEFSFNKLFAGDGSPSIMQRDSLSQLTKMLLWANNS